MYSLEVHVMDQCNLNCKSCTHFCPLVPKETAPKNLDKILNDLIRINSIKCTPNIFKILGGEPLMHPQLTEYLGKFRGVLYTSKILIWTNGLLLPRMPKEFFESCEFYDISVVITPYPVTINNPEINEVVNQYHFVNFDEYFYGEFWNSPLARPSVVANPGECYNFCRIKTGRCNILEDGKIFQCALPAFIHYLNAKLPPDTQYEVSPYDYVDIYQIWDEKDLIERLYQPTPFCKYCSDECGKNHPWSYSKRDPYEWISMSKRTFLRGSEPL